MTTKVRQTLADLQGIKFLVTRFNPAVDNPDDLDILVRAGDFQKCIGLLKERGYQSSSHDHALGGRVKGIQINLTKSDRIKIDLHQDFTWRRKQYIDINKIWENSKLNKVDPTWDAFLIMINVIFEKTYFTKDDFELFYSHWPKIIESRKFMEQAVKFGWYNTFVNFKNWIKNHQRELKFPLFLPLKLVLFSYIKKFDFISLIYYLFFRIRYTVNSILPYDL